MKIEELLRIQQQIEADRKKNSEASGDTFQSLLEKSVIGKDATGPTTGTGALGMPRNVSALPGLGSIDGSEDTLRTGLMGQVETILDLLEQYQSELLDPTRSLKSMEPTVEALKREIELLENLQTDYEQEDAVDELARDALLRSRVEVMKFEQGALLS